MLSDVGKGFNDLNGFVKALNDEQIVLNQVMWSNGSGATLATWSSLLTNVVQELN